MLTFDARISLRLTKGERQMSDAWIRATVTRMKQAEEDRRQAEKYALLKERHISARELSIFSDLQQEIKSAIEKINEHFSDKWLSLGRVTHDRMEINTSLPEVGLSLHYDSDSRVLEYYVHKKSGKKEGSATLDVTKGEVHYVLDGKPLTSLRLAENFLDQLINATLEK